MSINVEFTKTTKKLSSVVKDSVNNVKSKLGISKRSRLTDNSDILHINTKGEPRILGANGKKVQTSGFCITCSQEKGLVLD